MEKMRGRVVKRRAPETKHWETKHGETKHGETKMGKAFAGLIRLAVIIALAGGVAYNFYAISQLRAEVASLKAGRGAVAPPGGGAAKKIAATSAANEGATGVQAHAERAQEFLRKQDYAGAKRELEAAATSMRQAGADATDRTTRTIDNLRRTVSDLSAKAEELTGSAKKAMNGKQSENAKTNGKSDE